MPLTKQMILIVDDKQENIFSLRTLLQLHQYEVDTAMSGEEALKKILKNEYAVIILDVQMPGMDGFEVAEFISGYSKAKHTPIIFLSAVNIDKSFITKGYASGGVDYVTKPIDNDLFMLKIKTFYKLYEQTRELKQIQNALHKEINLRIGAQKALEETNSLLEEKVKERTRELVQLNKELEVSNTELEQYAYVASHDLQEPLRKIITFGNILLEKIVKEQPEALSLMQKIISSSERMRNLINDLLNFSRLSGQSHFKNTDLNAVVSETIADLELFIKEKDATIKVEELPSAEVIPGQMRQVFQNLISNALKFSKEGTPAKITIRAEVVEEKSFYGEASSEGNYVRIYICDNGIGFDIRFIEKIFTIFQRLHNRNEYGGTGIGLAIVKKVIERHNGIITAESKEGEGTTFIIVLPLKQDSTLSQPAFQE